LNAKEEPPLDDMVANTKVVSYMPTNAGSKPINVRLPSTDYASEVIKRLKKPKDKEQKRSHAPKMGLGSGSGAFGGQ